SELLNSLPGLTIYGVGSYARGEASIHSDLDLFFVCREDKKNFKRPNETKYLLFGKLIEMVKNKGYPEFSNDCQFLELLHTPDILEHLGGPADDQMNYFTARMLLLLESTCIYGDVEYEAIKKDMIHSYFQDFPRHENDFLPIFLLNDICRYWKTLLLNYENRRRELRLKYDKNAESSPEIREGFERERIKNKVRNFKLKHSRLMTCFASIAILACCSGTVTEDYVIEVTNLTPRKRLQEVIDRIPTLRESGQKLLSGYSWFLEKTALETNVLEALFINEKTQSEMDRKATEFGEAMFDLLICLDKETSFPLLRYLVI
ncbi:MAG: nucleotidyltransferase domain-containing protein, partial [Bacteroidetes bacterium]|nr:nucleotidyltransferase domain-containing protein [Bacteroidota bacterium]